MKRILLLVTALVLYGSLYPWQFHWRHLAANPLWILLHAWPAMDRFAGRDAIVNLALYAPFGAICFLSMTPSRRPAARAAGTLVAAALLAALVEMVQLFDAWRVCSLFDVVCDIAGAGIGILLASAFPLAISGAVRGAERSGAFRLSGAVALLYLWAGYELFPVFPATGLYALRVKLAALAGAGAWTMRDLVESFGGWLAAAALLESLAGRRAVGRWIALALLAVPLKLIIVFRTATGSEAVGALLGVGAWILVRDRRRPLLLAGVLAMAALVAGGLLPFRLAEQAQPFTWIPFVPLLQTPWQGAVLILLRKSFLYGSAVWLFRECGYGWPASALLVAVPLAFVEGIQIYLPGRTPESTDPILALLLGLVLLLLELHVQEKPAEVA